MKPTQSVITNERRREALRITFTLILQHLNEHRGEEPDWKSVLGQVLDMSPQASLYLHRSVMFSAAELFEPLYARQLPKAVFTWKMAQRWRPEGIAEQERLERVARDQNLLQRVQLKHFPTLLGRAEQVVASWEHGNLAEAVCLLNQAIEEYKEGAR